MTPIKSLCRLLFIFLLLTGAGAGAFAQWDPNYAVASASGKYNFNYNQTPDPLVQVVAPMNSPPPDIAYQWQQCYTPTGTFVAASSGEQPGYTFGGPLTQTTYFRQMVSFNSGRNVAYSNIIKVQLASVGWEDVNYVREHDILVPGITDWQTADQLPIGQQLQHTTYSDGMGRAIQTIDAGSATPDPSQPNGAWGDVVKFSSYDVYGRQPSQYLGYTTTGQPGAMKSNPVSDVMLYYSSKYGETSPFIFNTYDNSPMNRETNIKSPGTSLAGSLGKSITYNLNDDDELVRIWSIGTSGEDIPVSTGTYPQNTLYKTIHTDENNKQVLVYTDMEGKEILVKRQIDDNPSVAHVGWICTYSIYDDFGRVRCQIQPEGVKWLDANGWSFTPGDGSTVLYHYCFRYEYDEKGRATLKKVPGADEIYAVYDNRDRVVFTQDGNQRGKTPGEWHATLYDAVDRIVLTALYQTSKSRSDLQADINNAMGISTISVPSPVVANLVVPTHVAGVTQYTATYSIEFDAPFETADGDAFETVILPAGSTASESLIVYNNPVPAGVISDPTQFVPLTYAYYDNYNFAGVKSFDNGFTNGLAYSASDPKVAPIATTQRTSGTVTGTKVRVLGTTTFLSSTTWYDDKGRPIQVLKDNILSGTDITTLQYHFDGRMLSSDTRHTAAGTQYSNFDILTKKIYDKIGRLTGIQKKIGSNDFKTIVSYDLDDIGRLLTKHLDPGYTGTGKSELESLTYSYNIHEKVTGINKDYALKTPGKYDKWANFFGQYLGFDNRDGAFSSGRLDGKITGSMWSTQGDDAQRKYEYSYDNAGRVTNAAFNQKQTPSDFWSNSTMDFSVSGHNGQVTYDLNGNIQYLQHKGVIPGSTTPYVVDDLQYSYTRLTNQLASVTDGGNMGAANGSLGDFADGSNGTSDDYQYDVNGNLVVDLNKNITQLPGVSNGNGINYNFLDKPEQMELQGKGLVHIVYDASGNQLQKIFTPASGGAAVTTSYIGAFVYQGTTLQAINFEEGRIRVMQTFSQTNGPDYITIDGNMDLPGGQRGAYDYFVRDFQGNVRMILTEEVHQGSNVCTMETERDGAEASVFGEVDVNGNPTGNNEVRERFLVTSIPNQLSGGGWQNPAIQNYVSRLGNFATSNLGPNVFMRVMGGDQLTATTLYYYSKPTQLVSEGSVVSQLIMALGSALLRNGATTPLLHSNAGTIAQNIGSQLGGNSFTDPGSLPTPPKSSTPPYAFLYILFFDEQMHFIFNGSQRLQVSKSDISNASLTLPNIKAPKNGYAFVYVCNISDQMVYFDNLQVTLNHSAITEEDHYYSYGLKIAAISSQTLTDPHEGTRENNYLYNGKELVPEANLDWYQYGFRNYDPQIARFVQLDPLSSKFPYLTPYQYASCDPVLNVDLDGLEAMLPAAIVTNATYIEGTTGDLISHLLSGVAGNGASFLNNFGNNAIVYAYVTSTGRIGLFGDRASNTQIYDGESFTYFGQFQITTPPTQAEQAAAEYEKLIRKVNPQYGFAMGVLESGGDMIMGLLNIFNTDTRHNSVVNLVKLGGKPDWEKGMIIYNSISNADWDDPTTYGKAVVVVGSVAVPIAGEAGIVGDMGEVAEIADVAETAGTVDRVAFGFETHARALAEEIDGRHLMDFKGDWKEEFLNTINNPNVEIHFSLNDFEGSVYKNILDPMRSNTNWELHTLYQNTPAFNNTIFHFEGETFLGEEVYKLKLY